MHSLEQQGPDFGMGKKTLPVYITGFILCVILTYLAFAIVLPVEKVPSLLQPLVVKSQLYFSTPVKQYGGFFVFAVVQFLVQVVCFLRVNARSLQARVNLFSFIFSILVLAIIVGGSLWIMWNLNYNMMH